MKYFKSLYDVGGILPDGSFIYGTDTTGFQGHPELPGQRH